MTFLSPWTALLAAAIAVPLLLLLYFLKLRRRRLPIPTTLLWHKSFEDLQANVPFQRLRLSILLLLQALLILLILLALAEPVIHGRVRPASRIILLIDRSASMNATDADPTGQLTRLDAAKDAARRIIDRLAKSSRATQVMIIAFGSSAQLVSGFDSRPNLLFDLVDSIEPTDEQADLSAALQLAGVFAGRAEDAASQDPPDVMLISDGTVAPPDDLRGFTLRSGRFSFIHVGPASGETAPELGNVGIVSLNARRDYNDPTQVLLFARLVNVFPRPVDTLLTLYIDGEPGPLQRLTIPPPAGQDQPLPPPGQATADFTVDLPAGAVLSLRHSDRDALRCDDTAAVLLPPPARPRIALVHGGTETGGPDPFLRDLLTALDPAELRLMTAGAFDAEDPRDIDLGRRFDLIVFDRVPPPRLPGIPTITFGAVPPAVETVEPAAPGGKRILSWHRQHPLMRHVSLDPVVFADFGAFKLPRGAVSLAVGPDGPVMALLSARGAKHVLVGFELSLSNWPLDLSAAVFLQNVLDFLTLSRTGQSSIVFRPGEPITARAGPDRREISITGPVNAAGRGEPGGLITLPALRRVGIYTVSGVEPPLDRLAVSLLSDVESDIRPRPGLIVNARQADAATASQAAPRDLWPWLVAAALALLVLEWLVYCRISRT